MIVKTNTAHRIGHREISAARMIALRQPPQDYASGVYMICCRSSHTPTSYEPVTLTIRVDVVSMGGLMARLTSRSLL
jgi:hypothetical protein